MGAPNGLFELLINFLDAYIDNIVVEIPKITIKSSVIVHIFIITIVITHFFYVVVSFVRKKTLRNPLEIQIKANNISNPPPLYKHYIRTIAM